jgi:hypothetical protein
MNTVNHNYSKAPYFEKVMPLIQKIIYFDKVNLGLFVTNSIQVILNYLNIDTKIILSSSLEKDNELKGKNKIISICKLLGASEYYNAIGGMELYDREEFSKQGIYLYFLKSNIIPYRQFKNDFVPGLSILDVMMFNSVDMIHQMLDSYELV